MHQHTPLPKTGCLQNALKTVIGLSLITILGIAGLARLLWVWITPPYGVPASDADIEDFLQGNKTVLEALASPRRLEKSFSCDSPLEPSAGKCAGLELHTHIHVDSALTISQIHTTGYGLAITFGDAMRWKAVGHVKSLNFMPGGAPDEDPIIMATIPTNRFVTENIDALNDNDLGSVSVYRSLGHGWFIEHYLITELGP